MKDIDMIVAFAKLQGLTTYIGTAIPTPGGPVQQYVRIKNGRKIQPVPFHPWEDLEVNCQARDDWKVNIEYSTNQFKLRMFNADTCEDYCMTVESTSSTDEVNYGLLPKAVIECILKAEGVWTEEE